MKKGQSRQRRAKRTRSNILLDETDKPIVADFGLATTKEELAKRSGERAGTPAYMSPEQVRGETHRQDGRADIWALGVLFYQLLTGRLPFGGTKSKLFDRILHRTPRSMHRKGDCIPTELENITHKCLQKKLSDRYSSAGDVSYDLLEWLKSRTGVYSPHGFGREWTKYGRYVQPSIPMDH